MSDIPAADIAIIGAGPVGLFAAFYAGLRQMSVKIVDSLEVLGGQLVTLYPEKYIYDVAGFPKVLAKDLAKNLIEQGLQYGATTHLGEQVLQIAFDASTRTFTLMTKKALHQAKSVLIATGIGAFQPKTLPLPNAPQLLDRGLHYFVREIAAFAGQRILIVGGGDSAVDWANMLSPIAAECTLIHRRDAFRAHEDSVATMLAGKTKVMFFYELDSLEGDDRVQRAVIYDNRSKTKQTLEIDHVLVNIGFSNSLGPLTDWGLELEHSAIKVDSMMHTSRPGMFAAGDICTYPGKLKLIATGFGEACTAVNFAKVWLDPAANAFPGHSSNMK